MDFNKALNIVDSDFESILEIMKLKKSPEEVDSVRNLLFTVNLVIDYYLIREDEKLKIPVVYFPICNSFSQELCEDFVCIKFGLYSSKEWKSFLCGKLKKDYISWPEGVSGNSKLGKLIEENHRFEKKLCSILSRSVNEEVNNGLTMLYCENIKKSYEDYIEANKSWNRKIANKFWYLSNSILSADYLSDSSCPLLLMHDDSDKFYNTFIENEKKTKIENIVVFPAKSADGRYSDFCSDVLQKPYLEDFVNAGSGLRNVFFFCFSRKPYRLRRLFDFKQRMKERIQIFDEETLDFISFTYEESLVLNGKKVQKYHILNLGKDEDEIQIDYENIFDDITTGLDRYVSRRNEMSLCVSQETHNLCISKLLDETEADDNLLHAILNMNNKLWKESIDVFLKHFAYHSDLFVVTSNDMDFELKSHFENFLLLHYQAKNVACGTFGDLRGYQKRGEYLNEIPQKKIIVISFRNDHTESIFHKYPNSFDPFCINPDQNLIVISNYFFMRQYIEWGKYNYGKAIRSILKSDFRTSEMKPILEVHDRPTKKLPEDTREEELDRNTNRAIQQIHVVSTDNVKHSYARSEWMLYDYNNSKGIAPLSDLCDLYESCENLKIQPLTPLVRLILKNYIDSEREKDTRSERMFKEQPLYGLTTEEITSNTQLWKILLSRRVKATSERDVYDDIMSHFNERYVISFYSFKKWLDPDYGIPKTRKMQKYLIENYLGIRPPYLNLIRRIKERTKNDTEALTMSIRHFLNIVLFTNDYTNVYHALSDETKDLLDISSVDDIITIVSDINNNIQFETINIIEQ